MANWIKLTKSGTPYGLAHFAGDVLEVSAEKYKKIMTDGGCVPAEPAEIAAAKAEIARAEEVARKQALANPSTALLLEKIEAMERQLAEKDKEKPGK
jgi:hypothetical protein